MKNINLGAWSGTDNGERIGDYLRDITPPPVGLDNIKFVIPFKDYEFQLGEFEGVVTEVQELNPSYTVMGLTLPPYSLVIILNND